MGTGTLIALTAETNPVAIRATRNQSQMIQRRTSRSNSASLLTIFPEPTPQSSPIIGQNTVGVKIQMMRKAMTGTHNQIRYSSRVFHPQMSAARIPDHRQRAQGLEEIPGGSSDNVGRKASA